MNEASSSPCLAGGITVAVATLDRPEGLSRCLDALLAGDALPEAIVVVDQGQGDAACLVVDRCATLAAQRGVRVHYARQSRRGLSASRNAAIALAASLILAFTDDDCVPDGGWLAALARAFEMMPKPDAVSGRVLPLGPETPGTFAVSVRDSVQRADYTGKFAPWLAGTGGNLAVRRTWFDRIGLYDERLGAGSPGRAGEDADLIYRLLAAGARIRYEPDAVVYHERQSKAQRLAKSWGYGHGVGALCGLALRRRDSYAAYLLLARVWHLGKETLGWSARGDWLKACLRWRNLRGTLRGVAYGLTVDKKA